MVLNCKINVITLIAKDYGGRDYNYNQQYYYNMKAQNGQLPENEINEGHQIIHNEQELSYNDGPHNKSLPPLANNKAQNNKTNKIPSNSELRDLRGSSKFG